MRIVPTGSFYPHLVVTGSRPWSGSQQSRQRQSCRVQCPPPCQPIASARREGPETRQQRASFCARSRDKKDVRRRPADWLARPPIGGHNEFRDLPASGGGLVSTDLLDFLERAKGFEPSTPTLARLCSTPELRPHPPVTAYYGSATPMQDRRWTLECGRGRD